MNKIIGVTYAQGEYEGYKYNNVYIHVLHEVQPNKGAGQWCERLCMARDTFDLIYGKPSAILGKELVDVNYAKGGKKVKSLEIR